MEILYAIMAAIICFLCFFAICPNDNEFSTTTSVRNWVRALLAIGFVIIFSININKCNRQHEFNDKAKICGLGYYDKDDRISATIDSLCDHGWVKFGELISGFEELRNIYFDHSKPNDYIVGCRDTISGDVLEIELTVCETTTYDGEVWETDYNNDITKITLKNANGIADSTYRIDPTYFRGGSGFEKGYCAVVNDTCAMIFKIS